MSSGGDRRTAPESLDVPASALGYARRHAGAYFVGALLLAGFQFARNRIDWLSQRTVDLVFSDGAALSVAVHAGLMMGAVSLIALLLKLGSRVSMLTIGRRVEFDIRRVALDKLHRVGRPFYARFPVGEIMTRLTTDLMQLRFSFGGVAYDALNVCFVCVSALQVMLSISGWLSVTAGLVVPLQLVLLARGSVKQRRAGLVLLGATGRITDTVRSYFGSIRMIRGQAIEDVWRERVVAAASTCRSAVLRVALERVSTTTSVGLLSGLGLLAVVVHGAVLLERHGAGGVGITSGQLFAFLLAWQRLVGPITELGLTVNQMQHGAQSYGRVRELIAQPDELELRPSDAAPRIGTLRVDRLSHVVDGRPVLSNVSFEVPAGKTLAIVGQTGSGKSTLAELVARMVPIPRDAITLDGHDLADLGELELRRSIGYAPQNAFLFSTDVSDNVGLGLAAGATADASARINAALDDARITDEIQRLPEGLRTMVGERGVQVSGGQRQRLGLARALAAETPLLVLDDPLYAVDGATEQAILDVLFSTRRNNTLLLVTHRLAAASRCDEVLLLDRGEVVAIDSHTNLLANEPRYRELWQHQASQSAESPAVDSAADQAPAEKLPAPFVADGQLEGTTRSGVARRYEPLRRLWPTVASHRWYFVAALGLTLLTISGSVMTPLAVGKTIAEALDGNSLRFGGGLLFVLTLLGVLTGSGTFALLELASAKIVESLRVHAFDVSQEFDTRIFDRMAVGRLVSSVVNDTEEIGDLFTPFALAGMNDLIGIVVIAVIMLVADWRLALLALAWVPLVALTVWVARRHAHHSLRRMLVARADLVAELDEQIAGRTVIRAHALQAKMAARFLAINTRFLDANTSLVLSNSAVDAIMESLHLLAIASMLVWAAWEHHTGVGISFGLFVAFGRYVDQMFAPIGPLNTRFGRLQGALLAAERFDQILSVATPPLISAAQDSSLPQAPQAVPAIEGEALAFERVGFAYVEGRQTLHNVSFSVRVGQRVALVGPTGSGKSTIAHLLLRLYDVDDGKVRVLGRDVREWLRPTLRRVFSLVSQDIYVADGTLLQNIALGDRAPDRARAAAALASLGIEQHFDERLGGLDAMIAEAGANLSMGERQLLCFARAIYRDAPIVLLDEATANIDVQTESSVRQALDRLFAKRTTLTIAHRLSTTQDADLILVLDAGQIVERGRHEELLDHDGLYRRLYDAQQSRVESSSLASSKLPSA